MNVGGVVTVWSTHKEFSKLVGAQSCLKALLLYNKDVTLVRVMVETPQLGSFLSKLLPKALTASITDPKPCSYYINMIEVALVKWRGLACPRISRAQMLPNKQGEITPYVVNVIDPDYNGWAKRMVGGKVVATGILESCSI